MTFSILDAKKVHVWRYEDLNVGPRSVPSINQPNEGKILVDDQASFVIDIEKQIVKLKQNGTTIDVGDKVIYNVQ